MKIESNTFDMEYKCGGCGYLRYTFYSYEGDPDSFKVDSDGVYVQSALCANCFLDVMMSNPEGIHPVRVVITDSQKRELIREVEEELLKLTSGYYEEERTASENICAIFTGEFKNYFVQTDSDDITNNIMDRLRVKLDIDEDSDLDDEVYTIIHQEITSFLGT